jgi:hypothetical protein
MKRMRWLSRAGLAVVVGAAAFQFSPHDVILHARLQDIMRFCQQQTREELNMIGAAEARSAEFRRRATECVRQNMARR